MKEMLSTVTTKGQVTIPLEVRRRLKIEPQDKLAFIIDGNQVRLVRRGSVVASTAGAIRTGEPPLDARELREAAEGAIADEVRERQGG